MLVCKFLVVLSLFISSVVFSQEIDLAALKTEMETGPLATEIAPLITAGSTQAIADVLNTPDVSRQIDNFVTAIDITEAVDPIDFPTASNEQWKRDLWRDILLSVSSEDEINANATNLKAKVLLIFSPATDTRTNLAALQTRNGSRIEVVFGLNLTVSHGQVAKALALP